MLAAESSGGEAVENPETSGGFPPPRDEILASGDCPERIAGSASSVRDDNWFPPGAAVVMTLPSSRMASIEQRGRTCPDTPTVLACAAPGCHDA